MIERLITPPAGLAVALVAARRAARTNGTALDAELTGKIQGITDDVEHETGRALVRQTWALTLDRFDGAIKLPHPPLISVEHVKFYDAAGQLQTLHPDDYQVDGVSEPGFIVPAPGKAWPATAARINAVEVQYVCGYGPDDANIPPGIKEYILGMVENHYYPNPNAQFLCRRLDRHTVY